jgi:hypothetical protein
MREKKRSSCRSTQQGHDVINPANLHFQQGRDALCWWRGLKLSTRLNAAATTQLNPLPFTLLIHVVDSFIHYLNLSCLV